METNEFAIKKTWITTYITCDGQNKNTYLKIVVEMYKIKYQLENEVCLLMPKDQTIKSRFNLTCDGQNEFAI